MNHKFLAKPSDFKIARLFYFDIFNSLKNYSCFTWKPKKYNFVNFSYCFLNYFIFVAQQFKTIIMKKITLAVALFMGVMTMNAQADCDNAQSVDITVDGEVSVDATGVDGTAPSEVCNDYYDTTEITKGSWYSFSTTEELYVTVSSPAPADVATAYVPSFNVYSGSCDDATCIGGILVTSNQDQTINDAEYSFTAAADTDYFIVFDDNYNNASDLGTLDDFGFTVTTSTEIPLGPDAVTDPTPEDGATNVEVTEEPDGLAVNFEWTPATTGEEATAYEFYISNPDGDDPTAVQSIGVTENTSVGVTGMTLDDTYYWKVVALSGDVEAEGSATWSFTTAAEAGVEDFATEAFTQYVQAGSLNVESNTQIEAITLFNILGQQVASQKVNDTKGNVSLSNLNSGVYLAKVQMDGQVKTFKFVK